MTADYTNSDCLPFSIRLTAARKQALERLAARAGMSAPMYLARVVDRLVRWHDEEAA